MMVKDIRALVIDRFLTKVFDKGLMLTLLLEEEEQHQTFAEDFSKIISLKGIYL